MKSNSSLYVPFMLLLVKEGFGQEFCFLSFVAATSRRSLYRALDGSPMERVLSYAVPSMGTHGGGIGYYRPIAGGAAHWRQCAMSAQVRLLVYTFSSSVFRRMYRRTLRPYCACLLSARCFTFRVGTANTSPVLANPATVFIGQVSYSIYLWHWPVIVFSN